MMSPLKASWAHDIPQSRVPVQKISIIQYFCDKTLFVQLLTQSEANITIFVYLNIVNLEFPRREAAEFAITSTKLM